ncbi:probable carboxylesterase 18 [Momordica charantia]|uniref:Probable carboxylesterase 18 n=1 Tax=Momordica charantia TaxID=3673 RepID=A0A6J1BRA6_MOMCH|nr:probable carboxylesterase 18 [Momordica charantia]
MSKTDAVSALQLPWRVKLMLFAIGSGTDLCCRSNSTVNRCLAHLFDFKSPPLNKPNNGLKSFDVTVDASRNLWFRLYAPTSDSTSESLPLIVYFHGGGFIFMAPDSKLIDHLCQSLAREISAVVISVNYRLAPEHRCPCQYEDGFDVLKFIDAAAIEGFPANVDLKRCFVAGDTSGGNIAHHMILRSGEHEFRDLEIVGVIAIQPFFGGEERTQSEKELIRAPLATMDRTDWFWKAFLPEGSDRDHPAVNIFGPNSADLSNVRFPAIKVFVGGLDPLIDRQKRCYEEMKKLGKESYLVEYQNAFHGFYGFPELPEWALFIRDVVDFVQTQSSKMISRRNPNHNSMD